jgi:hypothetical protein
VREGDRPGLLEFVDDFGEHETERNAAGVQVVVAERIVDVDLVPQIDDGVAAQLRERLGVGVPADRAFQPQLRGDVPIRFEIVRDLPVDGADALLDFLVGQPATGVIDDRNQHQTMINCLVRRRRRAEAGDPLRSAP